MMKTYFLLLMLFFAIGNASADDGQKDYWVSRYFSVSYPLKAIVINSRYGSRTDPFTKERKQHHGIDLAANYEDVFAMFDGIVEEIGSSGRSGNYVIIRHGCYTVSYCHLSRRYVEEGDDVLAGLPIGVSGSSGRATGAHLHLTVKKDGSYIDPSILLDYITHVRNECAKFLGGTPSIAFIPASQEEFISTYCSLAMEYQRRCGIPSSVILSQMAHESKWGRAPLAYTANNFFGIKCSRKWLQEDRPYILQDDDAPNEKFCKFHSVKAGIEYYSNLLMGDRYKRCRQHSETDYHGWLVALRQAGYATDPDYVRKCERIIKQFKLYYYDSLAQNV